MGNTSTKPSPSNLPRPSKGSDLEHILDEAGFVFEDAQELVCPVTIPSGWTLRDVSTSSYSDYVSIELVNPLGIPIAHISGKFTSYDAHCQISSVEREQIDMSTVTIEDGWLLDKNTLYRRSVASYKAACRTHDGYPEKQSECDKMYDALCKQAEQVPIPFVVERIILCDDPVKGAADAAFASVAGLD